MWSRIVKATTSRTIKNCYSDRRLAWKGPGNSSNAIFYLSLIRFYLLIIIEEYGLAGGIFVVLLYLALLYRAGLMVRKAAGLLQHSWLWITLLLVMRPW
jgi:cell division protein FtsW (lipid II flippase)